MNVRRTIGVAAIGAYIAIIVLANWAVTEFGIVTFAGLAAPAAVLFVGFAFTVRDIIDRTLGRWIVMAAIVVGAGVSYLVSDGATIPGGVTSLAVASGVAFLVSELADLAVYEPVRRYGWTPAVAASNVVGLFVDSIVFLYLAFGSFAFLWGQVAGKAVGTVVAIALIAGVSAVRRRTPSYV